MGPLVIWSKKKTKKQLIKEFGVQFRTMKTQKFPSSCKTSSGEKVLEKICKK